jgi:hypothetical protein
MVKLTKYAIVVACLLSISNSAFANEESNSDSDAPADFEAPLENPAQPATTSTPNKVKAKRPAVTRSMDPLEPGWATKRFGHGLGFSSSFFSGSSTFIYERFGRNTSVTYYLGINKATDSYTNSNSSSINGTGPTTTTSTSTYGGAKNPYSISLGASYNMNVVRNDWILVRWGIFGGVDYFTKVDYQTGTRSVSITSTAPDTQTISETSYGNVKGQRSPIFRLGPVIDSFVFVRWLPQLAIGLQGGMLYSTDSTNETKTTVRTRTYQRISGVDQAPTSDIGSQTEARSLGGPSISTFSINGTTFSLFGNFVLRYVW